MFGNPEVARYPASAVTTVCEPKCCLLSAHLPRIVRDSVGDLQLRQEVLDDMTRIWGMLAKPMPSAHLVQELKNCRTPQSTADCITIRREPGNSGRNRAGTGTRPESRYQGLIRSFEARLVRPFPYVIARSRVNAMSTFRSFDRILRLIFSFCLCAAMSIAAGAQNPITEYRTFAQQLTNALISGSRSDLQAVAQQRRSLLLKLADISPEEAFRFMLPAEVVNKLPADVRPLVENDADEQGTLQVLVEDYPDHTSKTNFFLNTGRERLKLYFAQHPPYHLISGARVHARGKRLGQALLLATGATLASTSSNTTSTGTSTSGLEVSALTSGDTTSTSTSTSSLEVSGLPLPNTFGAQSTLVLLVNFSDNTAQPTTLGAVNSLVFTTVSNFYMENSQNQTWLTGDVFGWYTLPPDSSTCDYDTCSTCDYATLATQAQRAASNAGVNLSNYNRYVYIFPTISTCGWAGLGTIGGSPSEAWINDYITLQVIGHELGHNFGLYHAHSLSCPGSTLGSNCTVVEYGDPSEIMAVEQPADLTAFHKEQLGWLNYGSSLPITTVSSSGTYTLPPYETGSGTKALKILQGTDSTTGGQQFYYVEYRQPVGFDSVLAGYSYVTSGVLIHTGAPSDPNSSDVLNMNPQNTSALDWVLGVGETYTDATAGVTITVTSANASGATMNITLGTSSCTRNNPSITLTPAQTSASAGNAVSYTVAVTNNDSSVCSTGNFNLLASVPAGWNSTFASAILTLAPGATVSTTWQVTSASSAAAALYSLSVSATNAAATTFIGSATASYTVTTVASSPSLVSIAVSPVNASITAGSAQQFKATGTFSDNSTQDLTSQATWSSGTPSVATISSGGLATGIGQGSSTVTAALTGTSATTTLTVTSTPSTPSSPSSSNSSSSSSSYTLFATSATPALASDAGSPIELGMKFTADQAGTISAIRFYKSPACGGPHVGNLWSNTGQLLATATFTSETASGWQQVNLAAPVTIVPNTVYVVSYHTVGCYSATWGYFNVAVDNAPLYAVVNSASNANGVYMYGNNSAFPIYSGAGANYWVDVVFTSGPSPSLVSLAVTPASASITVGSTQQFKATGTFSDTSTQDLTSQVSWSSSAPSVATISSLGLATGIGQGSATITAALAGSSAMTTVTVTGTTSPAPSSSSTYSLFTTSATPAVTNNAGTPIELGMLFTADRAGTISAIRFYKSAACSGPHVGNLWSSTGQLLATATFTSETASGWQQVNLAAPVVIVPDTVYVVSYHATGCYSATWGYFDVEVDTAPLHAVVNSARSANGVYMYGASSAFPQYSGDGANYWVDVVFTPN